MSFDHRLSVRHRHQTRINQKLIEPFRALRLRAPAIMGLKLAKVTKAWRICLQKNREKIKLLPLEDEAMFDLSSPHDQYREGRPCGIKRSQSVVQNSISCNYLCIYVIIGLGIRPPGHATDGSAHILWPFFIAPIPLQCPGVDVSARTGSLSVFIQRSPPSDSLTAATVQLSVWINPPPPPPPPPPYSSRTFSFFRCPFLCFSLLV